MPYAFPIEKQQEADWCWAAVAVSVDHYFNPSSNLDQPGLAAKVLVRGRQLPPDTNCRNNGDCDVGWYLEDALAAVGKLGRTLPAKYLTFEEIQGQLNANLPVCARIVWYSGNAHFVIITGYSVTPGGVAQLHVADPLLGDIFVVEYDQFVTAYDEGSGFDGYWRDTYLLEP